MFINSNKAFTQLQLQFKQHIQSTIFILPFLLLYESKTPSIRKFHLYKRVWVGNGGKGREKCSLIWPRQPQRQDLLKIRVLPGTLVFVQLHLIREFIRFSVSELEEVKVRCLHLKKPQRGQIISRGHMEGYNSSSQIARPSLVVLLHVRPAPGDNSSTCFQSQPSGRRNKLWLASSSLQMLLQSHPLYQWQGVEKAAILLFSSFQSLLLMCPGPETEEARRTR